jgi:hypothetical protein
LRQAYDYWQDQPGNYFLNARRAKHPPAQHLVLDPLSRESFSQVGVRHEAFNLPPYHTSDDLVEASSGVPMNGTSHEAATNKNILSPGLTGFKQDLRVLIRQASPPLVETAINRPTPKR